MRLLLAEDDNALGRAITVYLMRDGHAVDWATNGAQLLALSAQFTYDCILLDLAMPELGGREALAELRQRGQGTPVIVITASASREYLVNLLDLGADDYLAKPFDLGELEARIQAVVRRSRQRAPTESRNRTYGALTLMPSSQSILWKERPIKLTGKEFLLLTILAERSGRTVSRRQIELELNGIDSGTGSNTVEVLVHQLRRKIDEDLIRTVRGIGYSIDLG